MSLAGLPPEVLEQILTYLPTFSLASCARCCRQFHKIIYENEDQFVWKAHFFRQPFDHPRRCLTQAGEPFCTGEFDYRGELKRRVYARRVVMYPESCPKVTKPFDILRTLIDVGTNIPPTTEAYPLDEISRNLVWLGGTVDLDGFIERFERIRISPEERQLLSRLHTMYGLTYEDVKRDAIVNSRAFVYDLRKYVTRNGFGPFHRLSYHEHLSITSTGANVYFKLKVDWEHIRAIQHVISMHAAATYIEHNGELDASPLPVSQLSLPYCQSQVPVGGNPNPSDWAGIEGVWTCSFCFVDHTDLLTFNDSGISGEEDEPLDTSIFKCRDFAEAYRDLEVRIHLQSTEQDPNYPSRPRLNFKGEIMGVNSIMGQVLMTEEGEICWQFVTGEGNVMAWSSVGVQVGAAQSPFGVLGIWTTVFHERDDPVGPFWLRKIIRPSESVDVVIEV